MKIHNMIKTKIMNVGRVVFIVLLGCVTPVFTRGDTQSAPTANEAPEKNEASEVVYYRVRLKMVSLSNHPDMASAWGENDTPDLYVIIDYNCSKMETEAVTDRYSADFEGRFDRDVFVIPNQNLSWHSFTVTCIDDDSLFDPDDTIFTVSLSGECLKNVARDGKLEIRVDKSGRIVDERYEGACHTLTFIVEKRKGVDAWLELAHHYRDGSLGVRRDWEDLARDCYKKAASAGHPDAQWELGWGLACSREDIAEAESWWEKATTTDDKERDKQRQWEVGQWFQHTRQNREKAKYWYEKASNAGHSCAQFDLGWYCFYDHKEDYKSAFEWFKKAAEQNNPNACYLLGDCYSMGRGVAKDIPNAILWYEKAESLGNKDARARINKLNQSK